MCGAGRGRGGPASPPATNPSAPAGQDRGVGRALGGAPGRRPADPLRRARRRGPGDALPHRAAEHGFADPDARMERRRPGPEGLAEGGATALRDRVLELPPHGRARLRLEEITSELQSHMRTSVAVYCMQNKTPPIIQSPSTYYFCTTS